eukprot:Phypoly_transcript_01147.p1 GENE.Phypoly_transcript_01147~~Phypoly_transcript_01147.p1  ORF type:complete len:816 (+),score=70.83 Phypoly_transcript_01147:233-2680(+)
MGMWKGPSVLSNGYKKDILEFLSKTRRETTEKYNYQPDTNCVLQPQLSEQQKLERLWVHSEKMALAWAIISSPPEKIIMHKNLRYIAINQNITYNAGSKNCIEFGTATAGTVVLEGQGHTIECVGTCDNLAFVYYTGNYSITLTNINVIGFGYGVLFNERDFQTATISQCNFFQFRYGVNSLTKIAQTLLIEISTFSTGVYGVFTQEDTTALEVSASNFTNVQYGVGGLLNNLGNLIVENCHFTQGINNIFTQINTTSVVISNSHFELSSSAFNTSGAASVSSINVTRSTFSGLNAGIIYEKKGSTAYMDRNKFYNVTYPGKFAILDKITITNNYVSGRNDPSLVNVAFVTQSGTNGVDIRGNQIYDHCLGMFRTLTSQVYNNYVSGCNFIGISVLSDPGSDAANSDIRDNKVENGISRISILDVVQEQYPSGILVFGGGGALTMKNNSVSNYQVACNGTLLGIYIKNCKTFAFQSNTVQEIMQEDTGEPCYAAPYIIGIIIGGSSGNMVDSGVANINAHTASDFKGSTAGINRVFGIRIYDSPSVTLSSCTISNISATNAPTCTGCQQNIGNNAVGLVLTANATVTNVTSIGVTIEGIYGGNGGPIDEPLPNALTYGGDAAGIVVYQNVNFQAFSTVVRNVFGGNGAPFSGANFSTCRGGMGYAVLQYYPLSSTPVNFSQIMNGSTCHVTPPCDFPCQNGGTCNVTNHQCICLQEFYGTACENKYCGNDYCDLFEDCVSCSLDCNQASCGRCGDSVCDGNETCSSCFEDCNYLCVSVIQTKLEHFRNVQRHKHENKLCSVMWLARKVRERCMPV